MIFWSPKSCNGKMRAVRELTSERAVIAINRYASNTRNFVRLWPKNKNILHNCGFMLSVSWRNIAFGGWHSSCIFTRSERFARVLFFLLFWFASQYANFYWTFFSVFGSYVRSLLSCCVRFFFVFLSLYFGQSVFTVYTFFLFWLFSSIHFALA